MLSSIRNPRAIGSLIFARIIYAINWVNIGAIFYLMGQDLGAGVSGLGIVTSTFYLGLGLLQIPGGVLAAKFGPKKVVVSGIFLSSFSVLGTSVSTSVVQVAILRFLVGWGMAFVFAPAVVIVAGLLSGDRSGMGVGLLNSSFDLGGIFGLFGWVVIASLTGWRPSLALAGGLGVLSGIMVALMVPGDDSKGSLVISRSALTAIIRDRQLIMLGLGAMGIGISYTEVSGFLTLYGVKSLGVTAEVASAVTAIATAVPIFTALWGGRAFDTLVRHRSVMLLSLGACALALAIASYPSIIAAAVCSALSGVANGVGYTFAFAGARELNKSGRQYGSLAVAWVNSISLTGSFLPPLFFSYVAQDFGYQDAWLWSGLLTLAFLVPIFLMVESWRS